MINGQTLIGPDFDNGKYPQVEPVSWEDFMRSVPMDQLAMTYFGVGQNI